MIATSMILTPAKFPLFLPPYVLSIGEKGPVAQLNRAFDYGSKGFRFES